VGGNILRESLEKKSGVSKKFLLYLLDFLAVIIAYVLANYMQYNSISADVFGLIIVPMFFRLLIVACVYLLVFKLFRLYDSVWQYAGIYELSQCVMAVIMGSILSVAIDQIGVYIVKISGIPSLFVNIQASIYIYSTLLMITFIGGTRLIYRANARKDKKGVDFNGKIIDKRVMIVGAGSMGMIVAEDLQAHGYRLGRPVVMVDDNINKQGKNLRGIPIRGGCENIPELAKQYKIDEIILCIPTSTSERQIEVIKIAMETGCSLKTSPTLLEMSGESNSRQKIRDVQITDLLPRPEVKLDTNVCEYLKDQVILVTGGGGSIGSELCRQAALYDPDKIIIFDNYENNAFTLKNQLEQEYKGKPQIFIRIGSVQDAGRLREVFEEFHPDVVFHAAAHKHVPLMEDSPCEAIKNNIFGTWNTAQTAMDFGIKKFIILSTDKAVNPANVMGATKRVTEKIIQYMDKHTTGTRFAAVRFGNVLGSNGSVIPIFKEQIQRGGPVTVTDAGITRYFMTIPEAAQLVVQAGGLAKGGEVFVLDMGEPVKILTLAENLIRLSGFTPYLDIDIQFTGLRPGEKLYEELTLSEELEGRKMTANNKIFVTTPINFNEQELLNALEELRGADSQNARQILKKVVPNFVEQGECVPCEMSQKN
jgi:FlaA1/EpsC-like NDP-sugar epimerase